MHPDSDYVHSVEQCSSISTISANWLQTIQWNREECLLWKNLIEHDSNQLEKLCSYNEFDEIIKQQIRFLENKLVRNFVKLIFARRHWSKWDEIDDLHSFSIVSNWFQAIGLDHKCKEILLDHYEDIEELLNADEEELKILLMRGFQLRLDELDFDDDICNNDEDFKDSYGFYNQHDRNGSITDDDNEDNDHEKSTIKQDLRMYIHDYIIRVWKAHRSMHRCLDTIKNFDELPSTILDLYWDSWDHWIQRADESQKASLASAIAMLKKAKHSPKPLPPLPDLKANFLRNYRINGDSRSTGSSPLSPPVPPLSAGNFSHRSTSSSSSSIIQSGFHNLNLIIDPNHHRRPTPPPTPPVSHHQTKKSFILLSSATLFNNAASNSRNSSERKFPTTPPPIRRHQTNIFGIGENFPLTKSKSHEEHLSNRIELLDPVINSKLLKKYNLVSICGKSQKPCHQHNYHHHQSSNNKHNSLDNLPHVPTSTNMASQTPFPHHSQRRRLATEPGSIGSISPILTSSNCSSPIAISPENQTYHDNSNSNNITNNNNNRQSAAVDNCFLDSTVPRSPRSQAMSHSIHHRFVSTMKINSIQCNVCEKQMFFGFKCRDCKYYCHRDCQDKAPNSCGLPNELVDIFKQTLSEHNVGGHQTRSSSPKNQHQQSMIPQRAKSQMSNYYCGSQMNLIGGGSHSSSSNPSSPAAVFLHHNQQHQHQLYNSNAQSSSSSSTTISPTGPIYYSNQKTPGSACSGSQFQFPPDINITSTMSVDYDDSLMVTEQFSPTLMSTEMEIENTPSNFISTIQEEEEAATTGAISRASTASPTITLTSQCSTLPQHSTLIDSDKSNNSALITSGSSGDSIRTVTGRLDSQDSQASDVDQNDRGSATPWPRQNSVTSCEWDIPYDELIIEEEIGTGRSGTVFRGKWHGTVAIKRLNMGQTNVSEEKKAFETFKQEVAIFRKTRHDNLVLFMGACMKPPHLAIVTSFCKGLTLHTHIHVRHDKFNLNRTTMIAEQICLAMGYLHARGIIHKDLKTKNIFYENGRVIITDFGLSSVAKLCMSNRRGDRLTVPKGWLCYLAPELIRTLSVYSQDGGDDLPFSFSTDIYAFGTVWFELLFGSWPFSGQPPEVIIFQVGKGIKHPITNFQASKEIKDLLYTCWTFNPDSRPDFSKLYEYIEKLPKKRLQRSPSHPAHLQHASEQTFF
ncbi:kinase suppressor of ras [Dermatophagoides farinae]|uniref:kinase suppressor of ras n=1 Tax=Dermatophagoides farinae TaxID=6954 RepID=UPI003F64677B